MTPPTSPWNIEARHGQVVWHDLACRLCGPCRIGRPGCCSAPLDTDASTDDRVHRAEAPKHVDAALVATSALAMDLVLAAASTGPAVLLTGSGNLLVHVGQLLRSSGVHPLALHGDVPPGASLLVVPKDDVRPTFAPYRPSKRPDVVVSLDGDLATASRLVRRGGAIGSTAPVGTEPTFAAVVQRGLTVLAARDPATAFQLLQFETVSGLEVTR